MATDPVTSTTAATGIFAMLGNGLVYIAGAVGIVTLGKILIDYINMRKDVKEQGKKLDKMDEKLDKMLVCSRENGKKIAVLETKLEERTGE